MILWQQILITVAAGLTVAVSIILVLHREYEDGLLGRIALAMIGIACFARFWAGSESLITGDPVRLSFGMAALLYSGIALFLTRHSYRFMKYKGLEGRRRRAVK